MRSTMTTAMSGVLGAAMTLAASGVVGQYPVRFRSLLALTVVCAVPAAWLTATALGGIDYRLRWRPTRGRLIRGALLSLFELLILLLVGWTVFGLYPLLVDQSMATHAATAATGLALGCLIGAGRPGRRSRERGDTPIELSRNGPPFFDNRRGRAA
jgi:hypothetical protein